MGLVIIVSIVKLVYSSEKTLIETAEINKINKTGVKEKKDFNVIKVLSSKLNLLISDHKSNPLIKRKTHIVNGPINVFKKTLNSFLNIAII